ncbi:MAG: class I SAM-dependent methyltransferase [Gaiellaceae bacterium]
MSEQYVTDTNLRARIDVHQRFSTAKEDWHRWLFERVAPSAGARILEVGCGPAEFWKRNLDRIDPSWRLTLTDLSPGMIEAARAVLGDRGEYVVADAQELPFADECFDVVLANHMLYHVPDRPKAFAEIRRVLVAGGAFHAATNGRGHFEELQALVGPNWPFWRHCEAFGLETGPSQMEPFFAGIRVRRFDTGLAVTEAAPLLAYVRSAPSYHGGDLSDVQSALEAAIARDGVFQITTTPGVIGCCKP